MITLYTFGPGFGLSDLSPFVRKAMLLLKMAGLPYEENNKGFGKAPKGKLPFILDGGEAIADTTFIRWHLENKYGIDFDAGLTPVQKAQNWALEKMLDSHTHFIGMSENWLYEPKWAPACLKAVGVPALVRPLVVRFVKRGIKKSSLAQGTGRHSRDEALQLAKRDIQALSVMLGDQDYFGGQQPCGSDATAYAFIRGWLCDELELRLGAETRKYANLIAYAERMRDRFNI